MLEKIKKLCRERGVSLQEVGKACGFGEKSIYNWANGTPAAIDRLRRIADYFDVTVDELLCADQAVEQDADQTSA